MLNIYIDGAARGNPGPAGIGVTGFKGEAKTIEIGAYIGKTTNNVAEYSAFLKGLEAAINLGEKEVQFFSDSELLVKQIKGIYRVKKEHLRELYLKALSLIKKLDSFSITHIPREKNKEADRLANLGIDQHQV